MTDEPVNPYQSTKNSSLSEANGEAQDLAQPKPISASTWLVLILTTPVIFVFMLGATCTGSFLTMERLGFWPAQDNQVNGNHFNISETNFTISVLLGAAVGIVACIFTCKAILKVHRKKSAKRESDS